MSWLKASDTAAMHPRVLAVAGQAGADPRCVNEVFGFVARCAIYCAQYRGDYVIDAANYMTMGFGDHERLIGLAVGAGLMEWAEEGGQRVLRLLDDEEDFLHMLSKEETEWARQRDRDNREVTLKGPVLLRDGDNCRYCGVRVTWSGPRTGNRRGTLDHRVPGKPGTVDTLVVACTRCNSARQDDGTGAWDRAHPLMSVPRKPLWGKVTARFLEDNGYLRDGKPVCDAADGCSDRASGAPSVGAAPGSVDAPAGPSVPAGAESSREGADPAASDQRGPAGPPTRDSAPADAGSRTVDTLVVACTRCNSARQDDGTGAWDRAHPLMSVPRKPLWGKVTARFLEDNGYLRDGKPVCDAADGCSDRASGAPSVGAAPGSVDAPAGPSVPAGAESSREGADPAASDQRGPAGPPTRDSAPADAGSRTEAPTSPPGPAATAPPPPPSSSTVRGLVRDSRGRESGFAGTGRDGSARPGPVQDGTGQEGPPPGGDGQGRAGGRAQPPGKQTHRRKRRRR